MQDEATVSKKVGKYASTYGTQRSIAKFSKKYPQYAFRRTSINYWKGKRGQNVAFKRAGRPNTLDDHLLRKVKDTAIGTRMAGGVINRRQLIIIGKGVVKSNDSNMLKEFGGHMELSNDWAKRILKEFN